MIALPPASLAITEWLWAAAAALSVIGYVARAAKGVAKRVDAVLGAVAANSRQNTELSQQGAQLLARVDRVEGSLVAVQAEQSRQRRAVQEQVVPKLEAVQAATENGS